jgi:putative endonuclease
MSTTRHSYCVYILGSLSGTLYIGFTGYLHRRVFQHKFRPFDGFTKQYGVDRLLYWESYDECTKRSGVKNNSKDGEGARRLHSSSPRIRNGWI